LLKTDTHYSRGQKVPGTFSFPVAHDGA